MTEEVILSSIEAPQVENITSAEIAQPEAVIEAPEEKLVPQSKVNELVGKYKRDARYEAQQAYERGRQESAAEYETRINQAPARAHDEVRNEIRQAIADEFEQKRNNEYRDTFVREFQGKLNDGYARYTDFEEVVGSLELDKCIPLVQLANSADNTADVLYELGKDENAAKYATLAVLANTNPRKAAIQMKQFSESIKGNKSAAAAPKISPPLSQVKGSTVGTGSGKNTLADYKKKYRG